MVIKGTCQKKFEIIKYPNSNELLNKRSKFVSKCRHSSEYLLCYYNITNLECRNVTECFKIIDNFSVIYLILV